jgi:undecaprenyl-diphosphatase
MILLQLSVSNVNVVKAQSFDYKWLKSINYDSDRGRMMYHSMDGVSKSMYYVAAAVPVTQLVVGFSTHDKETIRNGWMSLAAAGLNQALTWGGKQAIGRDRPSIKYSDINSPTTDNSPSFPSGHTSTAFTTATMLSLQYPKWYVIAPSFAWAGAMGYSRMYLGRHYPSDVFAGAIVGMGSAYITYKANKWLQGKQARKHKPLVSPFSPLEQPF